MRVLSIDQGTTNTKAALVDQNGKILASASAPLKANYPNPGWAEQDATALWQSVQSAISQIIRNHGTKDLAAIGIANQRETLVCWDARTSEPIMPAIVWQCRRTAQDCAKLIEVGHSAFVQQQTGLGINPLFPASKLGWVLNNVENAQSLADAGHLRAATVDSWLLWKLTGGKSFATDHSNASRTQLFDTEKLVWSDALADIFGTSIKILPEVKSSNSVFGETAADASALPPGVPIRAIMGDSHAALYGHGIRKPGEVKATIGTGSSLMSPTSGRVLSDNGLSSTIAWSEDGQVSYALEGNITVSAQAAAFMTGLLNISDVNQLTQMAQSVPDSAGVVFVPALAGLGAPHWNDNATGLISGMTHGTKREHLARATLEAIALQIHDVFRAMESDTGQKLETLRADGGASANSFLMQLQADILQRTVIPSDIAEVGILGAAAMAFRSLGVEVAISHSDTGMSPALAPAERDTLLTKWHHALSQAKL